MERDRGSALSGFIRVLCSNPSGDGAARALVMGALAPFGAISGQIYGLGRPGTLELIGNYGWKAKDAVTFRTLATTLPLPACHAFTRSAPVAVPWNQLFELYPALESTERQVTPTLQPENADTLVVCTPIVWLERPVGVLVLVLEEQPEFGHEEWLYLDGVAGAVALWLVEQRRLLIDTWRKAAPLPHAEITLHPRQHRILELVGNGRSDGEIADTLGVSVAMIHQDMAEVMELLGAETRDAAAGRARDIGLLPDRRIRDGRG